MRVSYCGFGKKALTDATELGGAQVSQGHSAAHTDVSCCRAKRLVLLVWGELVAALCMGRGALGSANVECLRSQFKCHAREKAGQATGNTAEAVRHMSSSHLQEGGWVPAAMQESKWKTMTYRKLCEARLVAEGYRWADNTNTGNRC